MYILPELNVPAVLVSAAKDPTISIEYEKVGGNGIQLCGSASIHDLFISPYKESLDLGSCMDQKLKLVRVLLPMYVVVGGEFATFWFCNFLCVICM